MGLKLDFSLPGPINLPQPMAQYGRILITLNLLKDLAIYI